VCFGLHVVQAQQSRGPEQKNVPSVPTIRPVVWCQVWTWVCLTSTPIRVRVEQWIRVPANQRWTFKLAGGGISSCLVLAVCIVSLSGREPRSAQVNRVVQGNASGSAPGDQQTREQLCSPSKLSERTHSAEDQYVALTSLENSLQNNEALPQPLVRTPLQDEPRIAPVETASNSRIEMLAPQGEMLLPPPQIQAFDSSVSIQVTLLVQDPKCCQRIVEVPICLPPHCTGSPCVTTQCCLLGRRVVTYTWSCGFSVRVIFRLFDGVCVRYC